MVLYKSQIVKYIFGACQDDCPANPIHLTGLNSAGTSGFFGKHNGDSGGFPRAPICPEISDRPEFSLQYRLLTA